MHLLVRQSSARCAKGLQRELLLWAPSSLTLVQVGKGNYTFRRNDIPDFVPLADDPVQTSQETGKLRAENFRDSLSSSRKDSQYFGRHTLSSMYTVAEK